MSRHCGLNSRERSAAYNGFGDAMSQQFNELYGTQVEDCQSWQRLCGVLQIDPVPQSLEACQDVSTISGAFHVHAHSYVMDS